MTMNVSHLVDVRSVGDLLRAVRELEGAVRLLKVT